MRRLCINIRWRLGFWLNIIFLFVPATGQVSPAVKDAPQPADAFDVASLISEAERNGGIMHRRLVEYTYTQQQITRTGSRLSGAKAVTFEAYPATTRHVLIRTHVNGVRVPLNYLVAERRAAIKHLEEVDTLAAKREESVAYAPARHISVRIERGTASNYRAVTLSLSDFLQTCRFASAQREQFGGRNAIRLEFAPLANAEPVVGAFITKLTGRIWIDAEEKAVLRLEGWIASEVSARDARRSSPRQEPQIIFEQVRLANGLWFPSLVHLNSLGYADVFNGVDWNVKIRFSDYKHFSTEFKDFTHDKIKPGH